MLIPNGFLDVEFGKSMAFGYKTTDVDIFVDAAIELLKEFEKENIQLTEVLEKTQAELKSYKDDENTIRQALIGSQKLGDSLIHKAKVQADEIIADATKKANEIIDSLESKKLQKEYEYNRTKTEVSKFKNDLFVLYKQHLEILQQIPEEPDAPKNIHNENDSNNQSNTLVNSENTDENEDLSYIKDDEFYLNRIKHYETLMNNDENTDNSETSTENDNVTDSSLNDDNLPKDEIDNETHTEHTFTDSENSEDDFAENIDEDDVQDDIEKNTNSDVNDSLSEEVNDIEETVDEDTDTKETDLAAETTDETDTDKQTEKKLFDTLICEQIETSVVLNEDDDYSMFLDDIDLEDMNAKQMDLFSDESEDDEQKLTYGV